MEADAVLTEALRPPLAFSLQGTSFEHRQHCWRY